MEDWGTLVSIAEEAARKAGEINSHYWTEFHVRGNIEQFEEKSLAHDGSAIDGLQSTADIEAEQAIKDTILGYNPNHTILGEESYAAEGLPNLNSDNLWIVDPLDGTGDFTRGGQNSVVSIAFAHKGELIIGAVYDFHGDNMYLAYNGDSYLNGEKIEVSDNVDIMSSNATIRFMGGSDQYFPDEIEKLESIVESIRSNGTLKKDIPSMVKALVRVAEGEDDILAYLPARWTFKLWDLAAGLALVRNAGGVVESIQDGNVVDVTNYSVSELMELGFHVNNEVTREDGRHAPLIAYNSKLDLPI